MLYCAAIMLSRIVVQTVLYGVALYCIIYCIVLYRVAEAQRKRELRKSLGSQTPHIIVYVDNDGRTTLSYTMNCNVVLRCITLHYVASLSGDALCNGAI